MKRSHGRAVSVMLCAWVLSARLLVASGSVEDQGPQASPGAGDMQAIVERSNALGLRLYRELKERDGNLVFSPIAIYHSLAMAYLGARGQTAEELAEVLDAPCNPEELARAVSQAVEELIADALGRPEEMKELRRAGEAVHPLQFSSALALKLSVASSLWVQTHRTYQVTRGTIWWWSGRTKEWVEPDWVSDEFLKVVEALSGAEVHWAEFDTGLALPSDAVAQWLHDNGGAPISGRAGVATFPWKTRAVLASAISFQGSWWKGFWSKAAQPQMPYWSPVPRDVYGVPLEFRLQGEKTARVAYMSADRTRWRAETARCVLLELPYINKAFSDDFSMVLVIPREQWRLRDLEEDLSPELVKRWLATVENEASWAPLRLVLPKLRFVSQLDLTEALSSLGLQTAFRGSQGRWTGIYDSPQFRFGGVMHQAWIELSENGTGPDTMFSDLSASPAEPVLFPVDRPFLFLVRHRPSNAILLIGRVVDPRDTGDLTPKASCTRDEARDTSGSGNARRPAFEQQEDARP